jgi:hypothetical protein
VSKFGGDCLVEAGWVVALDRHGELADLLSPHPEVVGIS